MSEMNNRSTYDFAAALRGEELREAEELTPEPVRPSYDFAAMLRQAEEPVLDGPTAEEAMTGLRAAEDAGEGTQAFNGEEVRIPPANEREEEEVEERTQNRLVGWLKDIDWKNAAKEGVLMLGPAIFSGVLWETVPQLHQVLESFVFGGVVGGFLSEGLIGVLSQAERIHPRFAGLARAAAAVRGKGLLIAQISASAGIGIAITEGLDRWLQVQAQAAQPEIGTGGGEGLAVDHPKPVDAGVGQAGGLPSDGSGVGEAVQPPAPGMPPQIGSEMPPEAGIDVQKIVDSLPKHVGVAQLPVEQQIGTSHWRLAEVWGKPLGDMFGLEDPARSFLTDAIKDVTQDQGNIRMDTVVNYDSHKIGDYLAEALARLKETDPAGWQVKVSAGDIERLGKISEFLKNAK